MSIAIIIKKVRRNFRDFGIVMVIAKGAQYIFRSIYTRRSYRLYKKDLTKTSWPELFPEGIVFKIVESSDIDTIRHIEDMEEWLQGRLPGILSHGLCIAAFDGPVVAGFNIIAFREVVVPLLNMRKRLKPHQAWSVQITVQKAYRKRGLASALRYRVFSELAKRGIRVLYGGTLVSNIASLKLAEKVGFSFIADVQYRKVLSREQRVWRIIRNGNC
jgi:RimJ/RimL family protein N-acetyltransferase